jgi:hypothetical protein
MDGASRTELIDLPCGQCGAEPGEQCRQWCTSRPEVDQIRAADIVAGDIVVMPSGDPMMVAHLASGPAAGEVSLFHSCGERYILAADAVVVLVGEPSHPIFDTLPNSPFQRERLP